MGSTFITRELAGDLSDAQLHAKFATMQNEAAVESGHSYSGDWNMLYGGLSIEHRTFQDVQAAIEYLGKETAKWESAMAVLFFATEKVVKREPTFDGERSFGYVFHDGGSRLWTTLLANGVSRIVAADQLTSTQKNAVLTAATELDSSCKELDKATAVLEGTLTAIRQLERVPASRITQEQAEVRKCGVRHDKASLRMKALDDKLTPKVYLEVQESRGIRWLIGGWAAM